MKMLSLIKKCVPTSLKNTVKFLLCFSAPYSVKKNSKQLLKPFKLKYKIKYTIAYIVYKFKLQRLRYFKRRDHICFQQNLLYI